MRRCAVTLMIVWFGSVPALAQGRVARPTTAGPIAVTLPSPPPASAPVPAWTPQPIDWLGWRLGWNAPVVVQQTQLVQPVVQVPYYVPVSMRRRADPAPPPVPYDPTKASMVIVGRGADGGGGVLRWAAVGADSVAITWLGHARPVREAKLIVADSLQEVLATRPAAPHQRAVLSRRGARFAGVALVMHDGSRQVVLVPLAES